MNLERINTTDSERRMHRILYFVKYLRMMLLHNILNVVAVALYLGFGIRGLYPMAEANLEGMKAAHAEMARLGMSGFFLINLVFTSALMILFFIWTYLSAVKVWKKSLKLQAGFLLLCMLLYPFGVWAQLRLTFESLSPAFSLMVVCHHLLMLWMTADMVAALWQASKAAEKHSFTALLDARLTRGTLAWLNKILDLPRTTFLSLHSFAAYLLALLGTILVLRGIMSVAMMGSIGVKSLGLLSFSSPVSDAELVAQSNKIALECLLEVILGVALFAAGNYLQAFSRRVGAQNVDRALKASEGRFVLYLRPFSVDDVVLPKPRLPFFSRLLSFRPFPVKIEEELYDVADGYLPLIAVGKPGTQSQRTGTQAHRHFLSDDEWQDYVRQKIDDAHSVVIILQKTRGVIWEIENVLDQNKVHKTLFMLDPSASDPARWHEIMDKITPLFIKAGMLPADFAFEGNPMAFCITQDGVVQIENDHWSTTSYRTAFSQFLAANAGYGSFDTRRFH